MNKIGIAALAVLAFLSINLSSNSVWGKPANKSDSVAQVIPINVGQTWQDVTVYRELNTFYQNDTGDPIAVAVFVLKNTASVATTMGVVAPNDEGGGMTVGFVQDNGLMNFIIPPYWYYKIFSYGSALSEWNELR